MVESVFKWKINNVEYAYITDENSNVNPFIYNTDTKVRIYADSTTVAETNDSAIKANTPQLEATYRQGFEQMISLLVANQRSVNFLGYSNYYNISGSACVDNTGSVATCPVIEFITVTAETAYTHLISTEMLPNGQFKMVYEMGIPKGEQGEKGDQGEQGNKGDKGDRGPKGEQGESGATGAPGADGASGVTKFTEFIFARTNNSGYMQNFAQKALNDAQSGVTNPSVLVTNPMYRLNTITEVTWEDCIPEVSSDNPDEIVWMASKTISNGANWKTYLWSVPKPITDSEYIDYEWYTDETTEPAGAPLKTNPNETLPPSENNGWYDTPQADAIWMAVRQVENGEYVGDWEISKIKGEDGAPGTAINMGEREEGEWFSTHTGAENEAHVCNSDYGTYQEGHLYVWSNSGNKWIDCGQIEGTSSYIHIKYAYRVSQETSGAYNIPDSNVWIIWTEDSGEVPGDYMGIYTDNISSDSNEYSKYNWARSEGQDGLGYEFIFIATEEQEAPDQPTGGTRYTADGVPHDAPSDTWTFESEVYQAAFDFIPWGWEDNLMAPTDELPFVWESYRRRGADGIWTMYSVPTLRNMFTESPQFVSRVFKRSNEFYYSESALTAEQLLLTEWCENGDEKGGTYDNPIPFGWSDTVPEGSECLWMTERRFVFNTEELKANLWTNILLSDDGEGIEREWYTGSTEETPHVPERLSPEDSGHTSPDRYGWYDTPMPNATWMAECEVIGGEYVENASGEPNWVLTKIKGESGEAAVEYKLITNAVTVTEDQSGVCAPSSVSCTVLKIVGSTSTVVTFDEGILKYTNDGGAENDYTQPIDSGAFEEELVFKFYDESGITILAQANVAKVYDGIDGADGENAIEYKLITNVASVKINKEGTATPTAVTCEVLVIDGATSRSAETSDGVLKYVTTGTTEHAYEGSINCSAFSTDITFRFYDKNGSGRKLLAQTNIVKIYDGADGGDGLNTAIVYLYKRSESAATIDWEENLTYDFNNKCLEVVPSGWSESIVEAESGMPLYVTAATARGNDVSDDIPPSEWSEPVIMAQDGATGGRGPKGEDGSNGLNSATVILYKRSVSSTVTVPQTSLTYTFATGVLDGNKNGWTQVIPTDEVTEDIDITIEWNDEDSCYEFFYLGDTPYVLKEGSELTIFVEPELSGIVETVEYTDAQGFSGKTTFSQSTIEDVLERPANVINSGVACYTTQATAIATGETDIILSSEWSAPVKFVEDGQRGEKGDKGDPGEPGKSSKMIYPAGTYDGTKEYMTTDTTAPYVVLETGGTKSYWVLTSPSNLVVKNQMPTESSYWKKLESYNAIYTDIMIARYGQVGEVVFYDNFMFSQEGILRENVHLTGTTRHEEESFEFEYFLKTKVTGATSAGTIVDMTGEASVSEICSKSMFLPNFFVNLKSGELYGNDVTVPGRFLQPFRKINADSDGISRAADNVYFVSEYTNNIVTIPSDNTQNGRHLTLVYSAAGGQANYGCAKIGMDSTSARFFEDGIEKKYIVISNEVVELLGFGSVAASSVDTTGATFFGWIVLNRTNISTKSRYGHKMSIMCWCKRTYNYSANGFTFDGTLVNSSKDSYDTARASGGLDNVLSVFNVDGAGTKTTATTAYQKICVPKKWFNATSAGDLEGKLGIIVTPHFDSVVSGGTGKFTTAAISAYTHNDSEDSITIAFGDGGSKYSGTTFEFIIWNKYDMLYLGKNDTYSDGGDVSNVIETIRSTTFNSFYINGRTGTTYVSSGSTVLNATGSATRVIMYNNDTGWTESRTVNSFGENALKLRKIPEVDSASIIISNGSITVKPTTVTYSRSATIQLYDGANTGATCQTAITITQRGGEPGPIKIRLQQGYICNYYPNESYVSWSINIPEMAYDESGMEYWDGDFTEFMWGDDNMGSCDYPPSYAEINLPDWFIPSVEETKRYPIKVGVTWDSQEYPYSSHSEEATIYVDITPNATTVEKTIYGPLPDFGC